MVNYRRSLLLCLKSRNHKTLDKIFPRKGVSLVAYLRKRVENYWDETCSRGQSSAIPNPFSLAFILLLKD